MRGRFWSCFLGYYNVVFIEQDIWGCRKDNGFLFSSSELVNYIILLLIMHAYDAYVMYIIKLAMNYTFFGFILFLILCVTLLNGLNNFNYKQLTIFFTRGYFEYYFLFYWFNAKKNTNYVVIRGIVILIPQASANNRNKTKQRKNIIYYNPIKRQGVSLISVYWLITTGMILILHPILWGLISSS